MKHRIAFDLTNQYSKTYHNFCIIGGFFENKYLAPIINEIDNENNSYITSILNQNEHKGKIGEILFLHHIPNTPFQKILLIGCGKQEKLNKENYKKIIKQAVNTLKNTNIKQVMLSLTEFNINKSCNTYWKIRYAIEIIQETFYTFEKFKCYSSHTPQSLHNVVFYINEDNNTIEKNKKAIIHGTIISRNINLAKDLGNMPPNICNSEYLAEKCNKLEKMCDHTAIQIIDENHMQKLGMNAYLAVGKSSKNPSLISIIKYMGDHNQEQQPLILIGKGVTFDSGGLSIKPSEKMDEMKYDMCGAASVYSILRTAIQLNFPINIIGILATCENMITNSSLRPGDIIKTLSGQTVEIKNTDAEGRLILCDTLTYATQHFNPNIIIDIATLTGACLVALGHHFTGLMSNHDNLANELIIAGQETDDPVWRLPLNNQFQEQINSNIADMKNTGESGGGTITAGCFLQRFVKKYHWAHLDIAGTAWTSHNTQNNATGRPTAMVIQFLMNHIKNIKIKNNTH